MLKKDDEMIVLKFVNLLMLKIMVKKLVKTVKYKLVLKMIYYMDSGWIVISNVCCWMETVNILDVIKKCLEKVCLGTGI